MNPYPAGTIMYTIQPYDNLWMLAQRYGTDINMIAFLNPEIDLNSLPVGQSIYICPGHKYYPQNYGIITPVISKKEADLKNYLRMIWEQHITWTRLVILSMAFDLPDLDLVTNRLLRNPKDLQAALRPFYGDMVASKLADLFTSHLAIAAELVKAAKAGDNNAAADAEKRWYANADEIAFSLAGINPYWSQGNWRTMLHEHLGMTKLEAVDILTKKYAEGISQYDAIEKQAMKMANVMADGIAYQFPNKFFG